MINCEIQSEGNKMCQLKQHWLCSSKDKEKNHVFRCVSFGHKKLARTVTGSNVLFPRVTLSNARDTNGNTLKRSANRLTEADNTSRWMEQPMITSITIVFKHHKLVSRLFFLNCSTCNQ
jgi:hypothetical protein